MLFILVILVALVIAGALTQEQHGYGWYPSGAVGLLLLLLVLWMLLGGHGVRVH